MYACACPTLIPSNEYMYACACPTLIPTIGGGHPPSIIMGARRRNLRLARGSADSGCLRTHLCLYHALPRPHPASHPHNTLACNYSSLPPLSVLPPPHTHTFQHIIFCKYIGPRLCVRFFVKGARSMGLLHIHTTHFINTRKHPTPKRLDKVYKGVLVVPLFSPQQRLFVCGVCIDTAQVASRWCPFSTHSSNGLGCIVSIYV